MLETDQNQDQNQDQDQDQDQDQNQDQDQDQDQDQNQDQNQSQNQDLSQNQDQDQDQNQDQNQSQSQNQDLSQNQDQDQDQNQDQNQSQSQNQDQDQDLSQNQDQDQDQSQNQDQDLSQNQDQDQDQDQNQDQNQSQSQNQDQDQDLSQNQDQDQDQNNPQTRTSAAAFKAFLMKSSTKTNTNLYDHLTQVLLKIMDERPPDVVDVFEDISREVKRAQFVNKQSTLRDMSEDDPAVTLAEQQRSLFIFPEEQDQEDELLEPALPNLTEVGHYLEQIGVGLGRGELLKVYLALRQLVKTNALPRCRFWGKILGTESNYIIAEVEYREGEEEEDERSEEEVFGERDNEEKEDREIDIPQSTYKPPPVVPVEAPGTGTNKCVYYVSKEPGFPWTKLPSVTPAQITCARQIRKFFTGRLDAPIMSYPPFPGNEANYLRAQIARISAGTQVSPLGFYQFKEEEGFEEDERPQDSYEVNPEFEGISAAKLSKSLSLWVHHTQHILEQGRCTWVNLTIKAEELNDEEEEEKEEEPEEAEPEIGPPLLTTLSQDAELFHTPPWTLKISSSLTPEHAVAYVRSNLWPGAYAYAFGKKFENIYIGWGLKYTGGGYSPPVPHPPQREYPSGPEITEALDPTVEEEQALKDALEEQEAAKEEMEETDEEEDDD